MIPRRFLPFLACIVALPLAGMAQSAPKKESDAVQTLIPWLLDDAEAFKGIRFADVIAATSGKRVLPVDSKDPEDKRIVDQIGKALDEVLVAMNAPESKIRDTRRVNEMSSKFEEAIQARLNALPGFACSFPTTSVGRQLRSGYPDLRLLDKSSGRVFYLDPKLFAKGSKASSFRTFYFEPKRETNKVNDDARHLIIGIEHERGEDGVERFLKWELIDLANLRVKLKAEFEGSNADMYRPEAVVGSGPR